MKLLLVIVFIVAVFTVEGQEFRNENPSANTLDKTQFFSDGTNSIGKVLDFQDSPEFHNYIEEDQNIPDGHTKHVSDEEIRQLKEGNGQHKRKHRRSRCKARNACVVMGGFCVTNATRCNGRLVHEGCKGTNCQCCVPGTLEDKLNSLQQELESIKQTMNNSNKSINSELQAVKVNMNQSNAELQDIKTNTNTSLTNINSKLESLSQNQAGCPKGFFQVAASGQCFKYFTDITRTWHAAKSKCAAEGLVLAKPFDPLVLRSYMVMRYGGHHSAWVGARGTGSRVNWDRDGTMFGSYNPMWWNGQPGSDVSTSYCMRLRVYKGDMKSNPNQVYNMGGCSWSEFTLCELLRE